MSNMCVAKVVDTNNTMNQLCDTVERLLYENKIYYESVYSDNSHIIIDCDGDWKHEHLRLRNFVLDNFKNLEYSFCDSKDTDDDCYYGSHYFRVIF